MLFGGSMRFYLSIHLGVNHHYTNPRSPTRGTIPERTWYTSQAFLLLMADVFMSLSTTDNVQYSPSWWVAIAASKLPHGSKLFVLEYIILPLMKDKIAGVCIWYFWEKCAIQRDWLSTDHSVWIYACACFMAEIVGVSDMGIKQSVNVCKRAYCFHFSK